MSPYVYNCKLVRVIDGDTAVVDIDLGFNMWYNKVHVRIVGVDTPEVRGKSDLHEQAGDIVTDIAENWLKSCSNLKIKSHSVGTYRGRIIGDFINDKKEHLSEYLLTNKYAKEYKDRREEWLEKELQLIIDSVNNG